VPFFSVRLALGAAFAVAVFGVGAPPAHAQG
jgi:hypothetical protein